MEFSLHFYWYLVGSQLGFAARKQVRIEMNLFATSLFRIPMFLQLNWIFFKASTCVNVIECCLSASRWQSFCQFRNYRILTAIELVLHVQNLKINVFFAKHFTAVVNLDAWTFFKSIYERKSVVTGCRSKCNRSFSVALFRSFHSQFWFDFPLNNIQMLCYASFWKK